MAIEFKPSSMAISHRDEMLDIRRQAQEWADARIREQTEPVIASSARAEAEAKMTVELAKAQVAALVTELAQTKCDLELTRRAQEAQTRLLIEYDHCAMLRATTNQEPGKSPGITGD